MSARDTALSALIACRRANAWSDGVLREYIRRDGLDRRDAALASRLCYGVLQNRMLLDFYIASFLRGRLRDLQPAVLDILRLGVYQLVLSDRIPDQAAVNEAVEQAKRCANSRAAGLVNGVLRNIARGRDKLPEPPDLATKYSHPAALTALLREAVGDELLEPTLRCDNESPRTAVQVNTLKIAPAALRAHWEEAGIACESLPWQPGCLLLSGAGGVESLPGYAEGWFYVQDPAARLAVSAAGLAPGMRVLDCCAAPGGKSFAAALAMENRGEILSCDIHPHKLKLIETGAERLGVPILRTALQDASVFQPEQENAFDAVLADVPCSGLGVIRKKPDIRYKDLSALGQLPTVQAAILENVGQYVRPGGALLYSTCTILRRENEDVVSAFLASHPEFSAEPMALPEALRLPNRGTATLIPCLHGTDGFFLAKLRKKS